MMKKWLKVAFSTATLITGLFVVGMGTNQLVDNIFDITNKIYENEEA